MQTLQAGSGRAVRLVGGVDGPARLHPPGVALAPAAPHAGALGGGVLFLLCMSNFRMSKEAGVIRVEFATEGGLYTNGLRWGIRGRGRRGLGLGLMGGVGDMAWFEQCWCLFASPNGWGGLHGSG